MADLFDRRGIEPCPSDGERVAAGTKSLRVQIWVWASSPGLQVVAPTLGPAFLPFHDKGLATWNQVLDVAIGRAIFVFLKSQNG